MKYTGLTEKEHIKTGEVLKESIKTISNLFGRYKRTGTIHKRATKIYWSIMELKSDLEIEMNKDGFDSKGVYYDI